MTSFASLFGALEAANVRYLVAGGVAVVLHGHPRLTLDVDLLLDLDREQATRAIETLVKLGFRSRAPVDPLQFADPATRGAWVRDRGMQVFSLVDPQSPTRVVDLFAEHPLPFEELWSRAVELELEGTRVRVVSLSDLIRLKRMAGRPQDLADLEELEAIRRERERSP